MTRLLTALGIASLLLGLLFQGGACNRPSESDCRQAIDNIRRLHGTDRDDKSEIAGAVRSCRGGSTKKSVQCVLNAKTVEDVKGCQFGMYDEMFGQDDDKKDAPKDDDKKDAPKDDDKKDAPKDDDKKDAPKDDDKKDAPKDDDKKDTPKDDDKKDTLKDDNKETPTDGEKKTDDEK